MGELIAHVCDIAASIELTCKMQDSLEVHRAAKLIAREMGFPLVSPDGAPVDYGLLMKGNGLLPANVVFSDLEEDGHIDMRLVAEITANEGESDHTVGQISHTHTSDGTDGPAGPEIVVLERKSLLGSDDLDKPVDVIFEAKAQRLVQQAVSEEPYRETFGILVGHVSSEGGMRVVHATDVMRAKDAKGTRTNVKMGHKAWESLFIEKDSMHSESQIVGWFHTHAGWGVMFSENDSFIHKHYFKHPNHVGYVLDSTTGHDGFFCWQDGSIELLPSYGFKGTAEEVCYQSEAAGTSRFSLPDLKNVLIALLVVGLVWLGYDKLSTNEQKEESRAAVDITVEKETSPVPTYKSGEKDRVYRLAEGDSLWSLCSRIYDNANLHRALAVYNEIDDHSKIRPGMEIYLPPKDVLETIDKTLR